MEGRKRWLASMLTINLVGGCLVLASYGYMLGTYPKLQTALWGELPKSLKKMYTVSMFLAMFGYFAFTSYIVWGKAKLQGTHQTSYPWKLCYSLVLFPSALWMPLTYLVLEHPTTLLWVSIRVVLFAVGTGSFGIVVGLLRQRMREWSIGYTLALLGALAFLWQTLGLDALVWPIYFAPMLRV
ncbi:MAG: hypothetical protein EP343_06500 [Deltaproteobacteria bacterium]|nr:MAG: hypothetical protein EP343_06500 [Deltaproteobacteria bacterium]